MGRTERSPSGAGGPGAGLQDWDLTQVQLWVLLGPSAAELYV